MSHEPFRRTLRRLDDEPPVFFANEVERHLFPIRDTLGTPELLPRPSQQDLAKRAGLTETDVSRCLKDPAARELRLQWETALELDKVLGWIGRPHR